MIGFFKMTQNKLIIFLFVLLTTKSAMTADPFDNTIFTFENEIPTSDQLGQPILDQNAASNSANGEAALDQPINTRYPITRYSLQGVIKSMNQTRMMFVSAEENTKFLLSVNDCLGLNCAYVTNIDKRGVITFEDEEGIYRFQVGYAPYIVEQKITEDDVETEEDIVSNDESGEEEIESVTDDVVSELSIAESRIQELETENISLLSEVDFLTSSNEASQDTIAVLEQNNVQLNENISQLQEDLQNNLANTNQTASTNNEDTIKLQEAENNIINLEQKINEQENAIESLKAELQNISSNEDTSSNENNLNLDNLQNEINKLNEELDNKNNLLRESADKISSQVNQIQDLENQLNQSTNESSNNLSSDEANLSNSENNDDATADTTQEQNINSTDEDDNVSTNIENVAESNSNKIMVAKEDVNIREEPSPHSSVIGVLLKNTEVSVVDSEQGWYKIVLDDGKTGYIYTPMLKAKN